MVKKIIFILLTAVMCACSHDVSTTTDFSVTLDPANTYQAGTPVTFNFRGTVDNLLFYSGEEDNPGIAIKNQQNYMDSFSYRWEKPGTYKVKFIGTNVNYSSSSRMENDLTVVIIEYR